MVELQDTVKQALNVLYHHPDDSTRAKADQWLQDFQRTLDAWQVADNLLHDSASNMETLIFCSQMLRSKVQRDFEELPSEAFRSLRSSLIALLKKFCKGPPKVRTQISIAVAAYAVQVPASDWGVGGIVYWLREEMSSHPEHILGFLDVLSVLPEEVFNYKIAAHPERRREFEREITSQIEVALNVLTACLGLGELKEQVLEAFSAWLRLRHSIPGTVLASHPLVLTALSSLNSDLISEAAVNVTSELIHYTTSSNAGGVTEQMPLIQVIVPQVLSLKEQLNDSSKDEEDVKAIGRLFADMGDAYVDLIASGSNESMMIVNALLVVSSHPEYDIASMAFNFWHNLQATLTKRSSYISFGDEASIEQERSKKLQIFRFSYESLVSLVCFRVQYPEDYYNLSIEDIKDFKHSRNAVADVLIDATFVLGGNDTLKILYGKLLEAQGGLGNGCSEWRPVEAALFCIRAISNYVSFTESNVMPKVVPLLLEFPPQPQMLQTVCLTIGAYSKWINNSPNGLSMIPSLMRILLQGMSATEDSASAASLAFRHICEDSRRNLCEYIEDLFSIYKSAVTGDGSLKISAEDSLNLVEALSMIVTELPSEQAKPFMEKLCLYVVSPLQGAINQGAEMFGKKNSRELTVHIERLGYIFRYVNHPEAVANTIQSLWPILNIIFELRAWDMRTMESLCRACKYALKTSGRFMGITIAAILEEIQRLYQHHQQPCFLYLSSEVIKIFGSDPSCASYLSSLIESLFTRTTCLLTNIKDFTARPDIADDCFLLASRCIRYCPQLFLPSSVFPSLIDCAMVGVTVQHREASNSMLSFLSDIFDIAKSGQEQYKSIRDTVLIPRGATITRILIASLAGALPSSRIETVTYSLLALTRAYGTGALEWAQATVSLIPSTAVTDVERGRFVKALSDAAVGVDINSVMSCVEEFSEVCRRNRIVHDIVQSSLRPLEINFVGGA